MIIFLSLLLLETRPHFGGRLALDSYPASCLQAPESQAWEAMPCCFPFAITQLNLCLLPIAVSSPLPWEDLGVLLTPWGDLAESSCPWPSSLSLSSSLLLLCGGGLSLTATTFQNQGPSSVSLTQGQTYWRSLNAGFLAHGTSLSLLLQQGGHPSHVHSVKSGYRGSHYGVIPPKQWFPKDGKVCHSETLEATDDAEEGREL